MEASFCLSIKIQTIYVGPLFKGGVQDFVRASRSFLESLGSFILVHWAPYILYLSCGLSFSTGLGASGRPLLKETTAGEFRVYRASMTLL